MSVILVTGGTGLVGKALEAVANESPDPQQKWIFVGSSDADLTDWNATRALFERHRPTHVIHLAAKVGGLFKNMKYRVEMWRDNVNINNNVMECCRIFGVRKLVSCLSTCIFPDKVTYPIDESMLHNGPPHFSNEGYAYAKRMVDVLSRSYREEYGCNFVTVAPTNIYGSHDNFHLEDSHVIPGLIHRMYIAKRDGTPMVVMGSGRPLRQFIFAPDLARLLLWTLRTYDDVEPIILSTDVQDEVSIATAAQYIADAMQLQSPLQFDTTRADGQHVKTVSNAKLRRYLPDFKFTPLKEGITASVNWFVENYDCARK